MSKYRIIYNKGDNVFLYSIFLTFLIANIIKSEEQAITIVPVADLCTQSLSKIYNTNDNIENLYKNMPFAEDKGYYSCPRVHQLLFNEQVVIKQEKGEEVECEVPNIFFRTENGNVIRRFWTLKKNIKKLKSLKEEGFDLDLFPQPYVDKKGTILINNTILTLVLPWYDPVTGQHYSAGTRFKRYKSKDNKNYYAIKIVDFKKYKNRVSYVPKKIAYINYSKNKDLCCKSFIKVLKGWANCGDDFVPYVTGGCSFIKTYKKDNYNKQEKVINGNKISYWNRPDKTTPRTGMDCSCLVARAAQICGIPYYYKNTTTLAYYLKPLKLCDKLEEGDLIWYIGHVLVVSDLKNNKVLESTGYPFGYGKVHEKDLIKVFKDVKDYKELLERYHKGKPLVRLNNKGEAARDIYKFTLFKMKSSWNS